MRHRLSFKQPIFGDKRGIVNLCLQPGRYTAFAWDIESGYGALSLVLPGAKASGGLHECTLKPFAKFGGRVISKEGIAIAGARLSVRGGTSNSSLAVPYQGPATDLNRRLLRGETDAKGRFGLSFVPLRGSCALIGISKDGASIRHKLVKPISDATFELDLKNAKQK